MDFNRLLDFLLRNVKTNLKELVLLSSVCAVIYFYKQDKDFFTSTMNQHIADKIFYRHKADSLQAEYNNLQSKMLTDKEEELEFLRKSNQQLDKILSDR